MIGPEGAANIVADLLEETLPAAIEHLVTRLDAIAGATRLERERYEPSRIEPRQLLDLPVDDWPAFLVVARRMAGLRRVDVSAAAASAGQTVYAVRYELRVFTYARAAEEVATDLARKRLTLAVRETLLGHQSFTATVGTEQVAGQIDETSLVEEYSDLGLEDDGTGDTIAASQTDVAITLEELTPLTEAAPVSGGPAIITHPALD